MTIALITGGFGFVGSHLRPLLSGRGWDVVVSGRKSREAGPGERSVAVELGHVEAVEDLIADCRPDVIFHLAASTLATADLETVVSDSVLATHALCRAVRRSGRRTRIVVAGSSAEYGDLPLEENPIAEEARCRPISAYGMAKLAAEMTARALAFDGALDVVAVRAFNHVGPGEPTRTVAGSLAARVAEAVASGSSRIPAEDLAAVRDFTDVRDVARGYLAVAEHGTSDRIYNLCSGRPSEVRDVLDGLLRAGGLDWSVVDERPATRGGIRYQVGSPDRIRRETGWSAEIPLETSTGDLLISLMQANGHSRVATGE